MQNGYIERLNGFLQRELLNAYVFRTINEVRLKVEIRGSLHDEPPYTSVRTMV